MKKWFSAVLAMTMAASLGLSALAEERSSDGYQYTADGTLTNAYEHLTDDVISVPSEIDGTPIKHIGDGVYTEAAGTMVIMEPPLETIGESAFEYSDMMYLDIPNSLTHIGKRAFAGCSSLEDVVLSSNDIIFGEECFYDTGFITFRMHCSNAESYTEAIQRAKGDDNFAVDLWHSYQEEPDGSEICTSCGNTLPVIFSDVHPFSWYYDYVNVATFFGILNGKGEGIFDPDASMTLAEAAKIAACIYNLETGYEEEFAPTGEHWYDAYVDYCYAKNIIEKHIVFDWDKHASRGEMAYLFSRADVEIQEINPGVPLSDIPDVYEITPYSKEILALYRRGIAAGSDENFTFYPESDVKRSEAAAFIARIVNPSMRIGLPKG